MSKFSVKKPFTILVAVIIIIVFGFVSVSRMNAELLPEMNLPYMLVITTYPGASPEKVEEEVSKPMENSLGTISHVKNILSVSAENYSMVEMEFEDGTDMDSAMVKVSSAIDETAASLPDLCGTPSIMEISMDMLASMYIGVSLKDSDIYELSDYVNDKIIPELSRQNGVASISGIGTVEQSIQVELNSRKIDDINDRLLSLTSKELDKSLKQINDAQSQLDSSQSMLQSQEKSFGSKISSGVMSGLGSGVGKAASSIKDRIAPLQNLMKSIGALADAAQASEPITIPAEESSGETEEGEAGDEDAPAETVLPELPVQDPVLADISLRASDILGQLNTISSKLGSAGSLSDLTARINDIKNVISQIEKLKTALESSDLDTSEIIKQMDSGVDSLSAALDKAPELMNSLSSGLSALTQGQLDAAVQFSSAANQISDAQKELDGARSQYNAAREAALKNANLDALVNAATLSQIIYAQNFSMPAGYIDDAYDESWLLKVGDQYEDAEDISNALLCDIDQLGAVLLKDVADVTVIDDSEDSYAKLNGKDAIVLSIYKGSSVGTTEVSENVRKAIEELTAEDEDLEFVMLMDQGDYIGFIISDILSSMLLGAILAIIVLALFLRAVKPTVIVAISIPLSVLFAIVLLYFADLELNIMTLSGLALGIGMLVDNSIVVLENIFRLRSRGLSAAHAAVQGTKQVASAIISSTLTTVCVFVPMLFTQGTVRELMLPMALSVTFCLTASLIVAMTVVPAAASTILRNMVPKPNPFFEKLQSRYENSLKWCLAHRKAVLGAALALLIICAVRVVTMGIVLLPDMEGTSISVEIKTPEDDEKSEAFKKVDDIMDSIMKIDGVKDVGIIDMAGTAAMFTSANVGDSAEISAYTCYVMPDETSNATMHQICDKIEECTKDSDCEVEASMGGMSDMSSLISSGLSINIFGSDIEKLNDISEDIMDIVGEVDGFSEISNGSEDSEQTLHLIIDRDEAMKNNLTVAQIYSDIASRLTTSVTSTTITNNGREYEVILKDKTNELTKENLMDMEFETVASAGASSGAQSAQGQSSAMSGAAASASSAETKTVLLRDIATLEETESRSSINRENLTRYITVTASTDEGYNTTVLSRKLEKKLDKYELPKGYTIDMGGESEQVNDMLSQMIKLALLAALLIYLIMVAQFQSLLSPFIILFTLPLAFTGGMLGMIIAGEQLSMMSLMGFLILIGTVVNNGIVFVDFANQLRIGGLERHDALVLTGRSRMRPIIMTALTTILAMAKLIFGSGMGSQMGRGMAIVIAGGLLYATFMTLYIVPIMYDIMFKRPPLAVDVDSDIDIPPDDAQEFLENLRLENEGLYDGDMYDDNGYEPFDDDMFDDDGYESYYDDPYYDDDYDPYYETSSDNSGYDPYYDDRFGDDSFDPYYDSSFNDNGFEPENI